MQYNNERPSSSTDGDIVNEILGVSDDDDDDDLKSLISLSDYDDDCDEFENDLLLSNNCYIQSKIITIDNSLSTVPLVDTNKNMISVSDNDSHMQASLSQYPWRVVKAGYILECDNTPFVGWKKMLINNRNSRNPIFETCYAAPDCDVKLKNASDVLGYLKQYDVPLMLARLFDFRAVFCVCHTIDYGNYVDCAFGAGGCNGWIHPTCVVLGNIPEEKYKTEKFVCPHCVEYLEQGHMLTSYQRGHPTHMEDIFHITY